MKENSFPGLRALSAVPIALVQMGCGGVGRPIWLESLGTSVLWGGLKWALVAGSLGLLGVVVLLWWLRRSGAEGESHALAKLISLVSKLTLLVLFPACLATIAFFEGMLQGTSYELSEGEFAREYFPIIGGAGADLVGAVLLKGELTAAGDSPAGKDELVDAFKSAEREIEAAQIPVMIAAIDGAVVRETAQEIKHDLQTNFPSLRSGGGKDALDWFMDNFSDALVRVALENGLGERGLGSFLDLFGEMVRRLPEAATREGSPETLSHRETAAFLVEVAIADGVIRFIVRPFCRVNQLSALIPMLLALVVPLLLLKKEAAISRWLSRPSEEASTAGKDSSIPR